MSGNLLLLGLIIVVVFWLGLRSSSGSGRVVRKSGGGRGVDTGSARWNSAVHEAGHYVIAKRLGATRVRARLRSDDRGGTWYCADDAQSGAVALAGGIAAKRATGAAPGCGTDRGHARTRLKRAGIGYGQAVTEVQRMVRRDWRDIERAAERLYRHGHIR